MRHVRGACAVEPGCVALRGRFPRQFFNRSSGSARQWLMPTERPGIHSRVMRISRDLQANCGLGSSRLIAFTVAA
jgi:hypothetical protein